MRNHPLIRFLSVALSTIYLATNCAFAHKPEMNMWEERRAALTDNSSLQLALLPASALANPTRIFNQLPAIKPSLPLRIEKSIPKHLTSQLTPIVHSLSTNYGTVRRISVADSRKSSKIIIHIQDVHMNQEAQQNIGAALQELINQKKVDLIALEGAFAPIDLTPFRTFPHHDTIHKVADYLLRENKISGPIHTAFTSPNEIPPIVGIDDKTHYDANVEAYRRSAPIVKKYKEQLEAQERELTEKKSTTFNRELAAFDAHVQAYRKGSLMMGDYVAVLTKNKTEPPPTVQIFLEALKLERSLNFTQVEAERSQLLSKLLPRLSKDRTSELVNASVAFRTGNLSHSDFYEYLRTLCEKNGMRLALFPSMNSYFRYVALSESVEAETLFQETKTLERETFASLCKTPAEKQLIAESNALYLVEKLLDFALTKEEWAEYKSLKLDDQGLNLKTFEAFYQEADARDRAMSGNLLKAMDDRKAKVAVLVTGGFHSQGMDALFQEQEVTSITFVPKITKVDSENGSAYLSVFTQEKTPLEKLFEGERLFLASNPAQLEEGMYLADAVDRGADEIMRLVTLQNRLRIERVQEKPGFTKLKVTHQATRQSIFLLVWYNSKEIVKIVYRYPPVREFFRRYAVPTILVPALLVGVRYFVTGHVSFESLFLASLIGFCLFIDRLPTYVTAHEGITNGERNYLKYFFLWTLAAITTSAFVISFYLSESFFVSILVSTLVNISIHALHNPDAVISAVRDFVERWGVDPETFSPVAASETADSAQFNPDPNDRSVAGLTLEERTFMRDGLRPIQEGVQRIPNLTRKPNVKRLTLDLIGAVDSLLAKTEEIRGLPEASVGAARLERKLRPLQRELADMNVRVDSLPPRQRVARLKEDLQTRAGRIHRSIESLLAYLEGRESGFTGEGGFEQSPDMPWGAEQEDELGQRLGDLIDQPRSPAAPAALIQIPPQLEQQILELIERVENSPEDFGDLGEEAALLRGHSGLSSSFRDLESSNPQFSEAWRRFYDAIPGSWDGERWTTPFIRNQAAREVLRNELLAAARNLRTLLLAGLPQIPGLTPDVSDVPAPMSGESVMENELVTRLNGLAQGNEDGEAIAQDLESAQRVGPLSERVIRAMLTAMESPSQAVTVRVQNMFTPLFFRQEDVLDGSLLEPIGKVLASGRLHDDVQAQEMMAILALRMVRRLHENGQLRSEHLGFIATPFKAAARRINNVTANYLLEALEVAPALLPDDLKVWIHGSLPQWVYSREQERLRALAPLPPEGRETAPDAPPGQASHVAGTAPSVVDSLEFLTRELETLKGRIAPLMERLSQDRVVPTNFGDELTSIRAGLEILREPAQRLGVVQRIDELLRKIEECRNGATSTSSDYISKGVLLQTAKRAFEENIRGLRGEGGRWPWMDGRYAKIEQAEGRFAGRVRAPVILESGPVAIIVLLSLTISLLVGHPLSLSPPVFWTAVTALTLWLALHGRRAFNRDPLLIYALTLTGLTAFYFWQPPLWALIPLLLADLFGPHAAVNMFLMNRQKLEDSDAGRRAQATSTKIIWERIGKKIFGNSRIAETLFTVIWEGVRLAAPWTALFFSDVWNSPILLGVIFTLQLFNYAVFLSPWEHKVTTRRQLIVLVLLTTIYPASLILAAFVSPWFLIAIIPILFVHYRHDYRRLEQNRFRTNAVSEPERIALERAMDNVPYAPAWLNDPTASTRLGMTPKEIILQSPEFLQLTRQLAPPFAQAKVEKWILRTNVNQARRTGGPKDSHQEAESIVQRQAFDWGEFNFQLGKSLFTRIGPWMGKSWGNHPTDLDHEAVLEMEFEGKVAKAEPAARSVFQEVTHFLEGYLLEIRRIEDPRTGLEELSQYLFDVLMVLYQIDAIEAGDERAGYGEVLVKNSGSIKNIRWVSKRNPITPEVLADPVLFFNALIPEIKVYGQLLRTARDRAYSATLDDVKNLLQRASVIGKSMAGHIPRIRATGFHWVNHYLGNDVINLWATNFLHLLKMSSDPSAHLDLLKKLKVPEYIDGLLWCVAEFPSFMGDYSEEHRRVYLRAQEKVEKAYEEKIKKLSSPPANLPFNILSLIEAIWNRGNAWFDCAGEFVRVRYERRNEILFPWIQEHWKVLSWFHSVPGHKPKNRSEWWQLTFDYSLLFLFTYGFGVLFSIALVNYINSNWIVAGVSIVAAVFPAHLGVNITAVLLGIRSLTEQADASDEGAVPHPAARSLNPDEAEPDKSDPALYLAWLLQLAAQRAEGNISEKGGMHRRDLLRMTGRFVLSQLLGVNPLAMTLARKVLSGFGALPAGQVVEEIIIGLGTAVSMGIIEIGPIITPVSEAYAAARWDILKRRFELRKYSPEEIARVQERLQGLELRERIKMTNALNETVITWDKTKQDILTMLESPKEAYFRARDARIFGVLREPLTGKILREFSLEEYEYAYEWLLASEVSALEVCEGTSASPSNFPIGTKGGTGKTDTETRSTSQSEPDDRGNPSALSWLNIAAVFILISGWSYFTAIDQGAIAGIILGLLLLSAAIVLGFLHEDAHRKDGGLSWRDLKIRWDGIGFDNSRGWPGVRRSFQLAILLSIPIALYWIFPSQVEFLLPIILPSFGIALLQGLSITDWNQMLANKSRRKIISEPFHADGGSLVNAILHEAPSKLGLEDFGNGAVLVVAIDRPMDATTVRKLIDNVRQVLDSVENLPVLIVTTVGLQKQIQTGLKAYPNVAVTTEALHPSAGEKKVLHMAEVKMLLEREHYLGRKLILAKKEDLAVDWQGAENIREALLLLFDNQLKIVRTLMKTFEERYRSGQKVLSNA